MNKEKNSNPREKEIDSKKEENWDLEDDVHLEKRSTQKSQAMD